MVTTPESTKLSSNDARVLNALFDPESALSDNITISPTPPQTFPHISDEELPHLRTLEAAAIRSVNTEQPSPSALQDAFQALTAVISAHPTYASAYANRAQVVRMQIDADADKSSMFGPTKAERTTQLFSDLSRAIALASPSAPSEAVSKAQASLLATTHTHRGYVLMKAGAAADTEPDKKLVAGPEELKRMGKDELEEMASRDFYMGGRYGDKEARQMAVMTNPYAKMCGAIVKEAMKKEMDAAKGLREEILGSND